MLCGFQVLVAMLSSGTELKAILSSRVNREFASLLGGS